MLSLEQINRIATEVATQYLPPDAVVRVSSEPDVGTEGEDTLRVLVVLRAEKFPEVTGPQVYHALGKLQDRLQEKAETRFASIHYVTDEELALHGGS